MRSLTLLMKTTIFIFCMMVVGCSGNSGIVSKSLYLVLGSQEQGVLNLTFANRTPQAVFYEHWFGQTGSPVAYCENEKAEIYVCSKKVFLLEDEFYTHETVIQPNETVEFEANVTGARKVGVKLYQLDGSVQEKYLWIDL